MPDFRKLRAFELAEELSERVHDLARQIPPRRAPGLKAQLCRAVSSIPANIAEGAAQETQAGYARFLRIALGSANETTVHCRRAAAVAGSSAPAFLQCKQRAHLVAAMLNNLIARVQADAAREEDARRSAGRRSKPRYQG
jgi:four helix bundle protein